MSMTSRLVSWARRKSPWVIHFNTGACNACDIEIVAAITPRFDVERFGIVLKGTPRHADVLLCSGPVTKQVEDRLVRIYEQMAEPKFVIAVGTCACSGGVFKGCYNVEGGIDAVIPVSAYVPGCPARPEAIIDGVVKLLSTLEEKKAPVKPPDEEGVPEADGQAQRPAPAQPVKEAAHA
jgi:NADH-quinone oxidoreductase B subunit